jgi:hypothetical protein
VNELDTHLREQGLSLLAEVDVVKSECLPATHAAVQTAFSFLTSALTSPMAAAPIPPTPMAATTPLAAAKARTSLPTPVTVPDPLLSPSSLRGTPLSPVLPRLGGRKLSDLPPLTLSPAASNPVLGPGAASTPAAAAITPASAVTGTAPSMALVAGRIPPRSSLPPRPASCVGRDDVFAKARHKLLVSQPGERHLVVLVGDAGFGTWLSKMSSLELSFSL